MLGMKQLVKSLDRPRITQLTKHKAQGVWGVLGMQAVPNFPAEGPTAILPGLLPEVKFIQQGRVKGMKGAGRPRA